VKIFRSAWIVPVDKPPMADAAVAIEEGGIVAVASADEVLARFGDRARRLQGPSGVTDLGDAVILPALVNAHTHLELSWMEQAPPPRGDFTAWVRAMIARLAPSPEEIARGIDRAIAAIVASGTAAIGDVGNTTASLAPLRASPLEGRFFLEVIGWQERGAARFDDAERDLDAAATGASVPHGTSRASRASRAPNRPGAAALFPGSLVPLGPHAADPDLLLRMADRARTRNDVVSVHLAESAAEDALLRRGDSPLRALMDEIGALPAGWTPPGLSPAQVLDAAGLLGPRTIAVHGVHLTREDARLLAARGTTLALCPRSNAWLGAGEAPVAMLLEEGVRLALGTDSLASNTDLDLLAELAALRALAPGVPAAALVRAATLGGAEALGVADAWGSVTPGKRAPLIALPMAPHAGRPTDEGPRTAGAAAPDDEPYRTVFAGPRGAELRILRD